MHIPRFHVSELREPLTILPEAEARHARSSLRLGHGDEVELFDGRGGAAAGVIETSAAIGKSRGRTAPQLTVRIRTIRRESAPSRTLTLIVAGCKGARLDWLIEKCTELGVTHIMLADFERSVVHVSQSHTDRLLRTAIEACKQCGRNWLPEITAGMTLEKAVLNTNAPLLVCDPTDSQESFASALLPIHERTTAVIGPEGGLGPADLSFLRQNGGKTVRLTQSILRVETAAICAAALWSGAVFHKLRESTQ